jgi:hypothetical protein
MHDRWLLLTHCHLLYVLPQSQQRWRVVLPYARGVHAAALAYHSQIF